METSKGCDFDGPPPPNLTDFPCQGKHLNRPNWSCPPCRLWPTCDHQGPHKRSNLEHILTRWDSPVDEPGTYRSTTVRVAEQLPNGILRLLRIQNGDIRNDQREPAVSRRCRHNGFREGYARETSPSRSNIQEGFVGDVGTVLGVSTEQPPKHRRCSSVFGGVHESVITTLYRATFSWGGRRDGRIARAHQEEPIGWRRHYLARWCNVICT
jgi:hypothetical protein